MGIHPTPKRQRPAVLVSCAQAPTWFDACHYAWTTFSAEADWEPITPAPEPTRARPGSKQKIRVLAARLRTGCELWHPEDNIRKLDTCPDFRVRGQARVEEE